MHGIEFAESCWHGLVLSIREAAKTEGALQHSRTCLRLAGHDPQLAGRDF